MPTKFSDLTTRLKLQHLRLITAIDDCGSLRGAAEIMGLTQPAVTKMLQDLEVLLGVQLFERHARGMKPTRYCVPALRYARLVFSDMLSFRDELEELKEGKLGHIRIGTIMAPALGPVSSAIQTIKRDYPKIVLSVLVETSDVLMGMLEKDQLDVVVGRIPPQFDKGLFDFEVIADEMLAIVVDKNHPLATVLKLDLAMLANFPWILQPRPSPMRHIIDFWFEDSHIAAPDCPIETAALLMTTALLTDSNMVGVLPMSVADYYSSAGILTVLPIAPSQKLGPFGVITRKGRVHTSPAELLREVLLKNLA